MSIWKKLSLIILTSFLFFPVEVKAFIIVNDIVPVFTDDVSGNKLHIEAQVTSGAAAFLQSHSFACLILNEYELSGSQSFNFPNALKWTGSAFSLLENARACYENAGSLGDALGYNLKKIDGFKGFDYDAFIADHNLNKDIAGKVRKFLDNGDITGIYRQVASDAGEILVSLSAIKNCLAANNKPGLPLLWKLLQQYAECSLFGNYATMMGSAVLDKTAD